MEAPASNLIAVVLAAGASRRMGTNKMLLRLGGESMVRRVTRTVLSAGLEQVWVVVGRDSPQVGAEVADLGVRLVQNPRYPQGMGTSFQAAVEAFPPNLEAAMFVLGDQPFLTAGMYRAVLEAYRTHRPPLVIAQFGSVKAPPHVFRSDLFAYLGHNKDEGAKNLVARHKAQAIVVELPESALFDIDTPEEYRRALERVAGGE
ncbi:nucleotidyltransferase family protein [Calidithermus roseus]|uniref:Purine catabolism protein PucB n=1 Tax=Calidithermus roseus TaxID=1644118 RepID=A0A399EMM2_9DEIN|nr:nucleotidyltransferase family protein [Calidithermus roseus]RIH83381.1 Purine catabolism protein PucB [Calidithermus roseus]